MSKLVVDFCSYVNASRKKPVVEALWTSERQVADVSEVHAAFTFRMEKTELNEAGGSMFRRSVSKFLPGHTASYPRERPFHNHSHENHAFRTRAFHVCCILEQVYLLDKS